MDDETRAARPGWYVVQVPTGSEERMCAAIRRACDEADAAAPGGGKVGLGSCFSPKFAGRKKRMGEWRDVERALLPGYVVADVRDPAALDRALGGVRGLCRVLTANGAYSPLDGAERGWIEGATGGGDRTIPLSFGHREGDRLVVTSGPLEGREAMVTGYDRRNCMAHLELHAGPVTIRTTVGLVVMPSGKVKQVAPRRLDEDHGRKGKRTGDGKRR